MVSAIAAASIGIIVSLIAAHWQHRRQGAALVAQHTDTANRLVRAEWDLSAAESRLRNMAEVEKMAAYWMAEAQRLDKLNEERNGGGDCFTELHVAAAALNAAIVAIDADIGTGTPEWADRVEALRGALEIANSRLGLNGHSTRVTVVS